MNTEEITETTQETVENVNLFIRFIEDHIPVRRMVRRKTAGWKLISMAPASFALTPRNRGSPSWTGPCPPLP